MIKINLISFRLLLLLFISFAHSSINVSAEQTSDSRMAEGENFTLTEIHIKLLKELRIVWDPTENGAFTVHPLKPFGTEDVNGDIVRITSTQKDFAKKYFKEIFPAIEIYLQNGRLAPGNYKLKVKEPTTLGKGVKQVDFYESEKRDDFVVMSPPKVTDGDVFNFTEEHRKLLKLSAYFLRENSRNARGEEEYLDVPALDPKRPYGDMMYYPLDIASELNVSIDNENYEEDDDLPPFKLEKLKKLVDLHLSMMHALIVFLAEAEIDLGNYVKHEGKWRKTE